MLGALTVFWTSAMIHDTGQRRNAARLMAEAMAVQLSTLASVRLELYAAQSFAPVMPLATDGAALGEPRRAVEALVSEQRAAQHCRCRAVFPATEFFRDVANAALELASVATDKASSTPAQQQLAELARADAGRPRVTDRLPVHLSVGRTLAGNAVMTIVRYDTKGEPRSVFGLVQDAHAAAGLLFATEASRATAPEHAVGPATLDSLSMQVTASDSTLLFGSLAMQLAADDARQTDGAPSNPPCVGDHDT